ncbi:DUF4269 domain-containing protein [Paenibacillus tuaregi]|uniref:DUF4269 domain-containing protein n=1 Tax=Paenibacillus tuaregi TaxID=1816681 RepID=UPI000838FF16|nr:DUF4269 domain-containing protein [Paenibacillus tuaregi]
MNRAEPINWLNLDYLRQGGENQRQVYEILQTGRFLKILEEYTPILVGTIPLGIEVDGSDLDIICEIYDLDRFEQELMESFQHYHGFTLSRRSVNGLKRIKANFQVEAWPVEIFGQPVPTRQQNGYKHMLIEHRMLRLYGEDFKQDVIRLKAGGVKTEPAFAELLGLSGDPYQALLELFDSSDQELKDLFL